MMTDGVHDGHADPFFLPLDVLNYLNEHEPNMYPRANLNRQIRTT
jgi:hypothetical protein